MRRLRQAASLGAVAACLAAAACGLDGAGAVDQGTRPAAHATAKPRIPVLRHGAGHLVSPGMFGMHILHSPTIWPTVPVDAVRIWDDNATWRDLEPQPGVWHWSKLDARVATARSHHAFVLLVLGQTPKWASSLPRDRGAYGRGAAGAPSHLSDWRAYVHAVVQRYKGEIGAYEIWNEPNWTYMYRGSPQRLAAMTRVAHDAVAAVDPAAKIVSPSFVIVDRYNSAWLNAYFRAGGAKYTDVTNVHVYTHGGPPESARANVQSVRRAMRHWHVHQPIWDTEHNLDRPKHVYSAKAGGGLLARGYLLDRWFGLQRTFWYAWNIQGWGGISLTTPADKPTASARAYQTVYGWLAGARERGCSNAGSVWACTLQRNGSMSVAAWSAGRPTHAKIPSGFHHITPLYGAVRRGKPGHALKLTQQPVLLTK